MNTFAKIVSALLVSTMLVSCSANKYSKTVDRVDLERFMGSWYVVAYRPIFLEENAFNAIEHYSLNRENGEIEINYTFNKGGFDGKEKHYPQTGEVFNKETNAHWLISPFWPLKFDYLVVALDQDYQWTVIGVPSGKYIWLMARNYNMEGRQIGGIMEKVDASGYPAKNYSIVRHRYLEK